MSHPRVASTLNNLAIVYKNQGRYGDAIPLYQRALAINEKALGTSHPQVAGVLGNLASAYKRQGRYGDAIPLYQRALAIREKTFGISHPKVARTLNNLGVTYEEQGRYGEAAPLLRRALAIKEKTLGSSHPSLASTLNNLGLVHKGQGRYGEAVALYRRALVIKEKALGTSHPSVARSLNDLADVNRDQGRYGNALPLYQRALAIREKAFGSSHPDVAQTLTNIGKLYEKGGRYAEALTAVRRSAAIMAKRMGSVPNGARKATGSVGFDAFPTLVRIASGLAGRQPSQRPALAEEALAAAQRTSSTSAGAALAQMAARLGAGDTALARAVRRQQDLVNEWRRLDKALLATLSRPPQKRDAKVEERLRIQRDDAEAAVTTINARLEIDFPDYAELANPQPLGLAETRKLLSRDEALVAYLVDKDKSYVWAVTRESVAWRALDLKKSDIEREVAALRKSLDPTAVLEAGGRGFSRERVCRGLKRLDQPCESYDTDLGRAHRLYVELLGPVANAIEGKRHLIVVPSGPLTGLPFHMLVTAPPPTGGKLEDRFKQAQWLVRRHAVTVLPSLTSLRAVACAGAQGPGKTPLHRLRKSELLQA